MRQFGPVAHITMATYSNLALTFQQKRMELFGQLEGARADASKAIELAKSKKLPQPIRFEDGRLFTASGRYLPLVLRNNRSKNQLTKLKQAHEKLDEKDSKTAYAA